MKGKKDLKKTLLEFLDGFHFVSRFEVVGAVEQYYIDFYGTEYIYYRDLLLFEEVAQDYIDRKGLKFDD